MEDWETPSESRLPFLPGGIDTHIFQLSKTRFGRVYRQAVLEAPNVYTCLRAHAVEIETDAAGRTATGVRLKTLDGRNLRITARAVVLAAGGIETPRLLLLSRRAVSVGLGNQHDLVNRRQRRHHRCIETMPMKQGQDIQTSISFAQRECGTSRVSRPANVGVRLRDNLGQRGCA